MLKGKPCSKGESKDTNLDLCLSPVCTVFSRCHPSYREYCSEAVGFLGLWDSKTSQIVLKLSCCPSQDSVWVYEFVPVGTHVCVLVFLSNTGWENVMTIWNDLSISTLSPSSERKEVEFQCQTMAIIKLIAYLLSVE